MYSASASKNLLHKSELQLLEESYLAFPGLVLANAVWQAVNAPPVFRPFSLGYVWKPYEGEVHKPLMASPDLKNELNELLIVR